MKSIEKLNSNKRLRSVCHSIAHHAVSGLSFLHPHLRLACKKALIERVEINLLAAEIPFPFEENIPLRMAIGALRKTFLSILHSENISVESIESATLDFTFLPDQKLTHYCTNCRANAKFINGPEISRHVDHLGREKFQEKKKLRTEFEEQIYRKFLNEGNK